MVCSRCEREVFVNQTDVQREEWHLLSFQWLKIEFSKRNDKSCRAVFKCVYQGGLVARYRNPPFRPIGTGKTVGTGKTRPSLWYLVKYIVFSFVRRTKTHKSCRNIQKTANDVTDPSDVIHPSFLMSLIRLFNNVTDPHFNEVSDPLFLTRPVSSKISEPFPRGSRKKKNKVTHGVKQATIVSTIAGYYSTSVYRVTEGLTSSLSLSLSLLEFVLVLSCPVSTQPKMIGRIQILSILFAAHAGLSLAS